MGTQTKVPTLWLTRRSTLHDTHACAFMQGAPWLHIDHFFETSAFAVAAPFRWGSEGRNVIIGPDIANWDFSLFKSFSFDEKRKLQFRAEFFNALNHAEFAAPGATIATAQFGRISGTTRDPRDIQLALKFLW